MTFSPFFFRSLGMMSLTVDSTARWTSVFCQSHSMKISSFLEGRSKSIKLFGVKYHNGTAIGQNVVLAVIIRGSCTCSVREKGIRGKWTSVESLQISWKECFGDLTPLLPVPRNRECLGDGKDHKKQQRAEGGHLFQPKYFLSKSYSART